MRGIHLRTCFYVHFYRVFQVLRSPSRLCNSLCLASMIEPLDSDPPRPGGGLPHGVQSPDVRPVRTSRGQEDGAVAKAQDLLLALDGLVEKLVTRLFAIIGRPLPEILVREKGRNALFIVALLLIRSRSRKRCLLLEIAINN